MNPCCGSRARRHAGWLVPGVLLAIIPKCPACFAGYMLLFTGAAVPAWMHGSMKAMLGLAILAGATMAWFKRSRE